MDVYKVRLAKPAMILSKLPLEKLWRELRLFMRLINSAQNPAALALPNCAVESW